MPRFYLHYEDKPAPPPRIWTAWRVILWTMLFVTLGVWMAASGI